MFFPPVSLTYKFSVCFLFLNKKKSLISTDYCKRRKTSVFAVPLLFMNGSYTHGIRNLRISGILISSPYNGGNRLHLLLYNFRQLLKGEFHNFLPLLLSNQQFSVLRSECTIPYHCILLITLFGFFEMKWTYVWIIHCKNILQTI